MCHGHVAGRLGVNIGPTKAGQALPILAGCRWSGSTRPGKPRPGHARPATLCQIRPGRRLFVDVYVTRCTTLMLLSRRVWRTVSDASYALLVLTIITAAALSCTALLSQAVRTAPDRSWARNFNAFVIGAAYAVVVCRSSFFYATVKSSSPLAHRVAYILRKTETCRETWATTHLKGTPNDWTGRCSSGQLG